MNLLLMDIIYIVIISFFNLFIKKDKKVNKYELLSDNSYSIKGNLHIMVRIKIVVIIL